MKRTLSILLCLTLLLGVSGFPAASADSLNVDSYYELPESVTVDGVTITADGQITVTDEKLLSVLNDIDSAADWTSLTIDNAKLNVGGDINADGNRVIRGINGAEITIAGDVRAQALGYGTVISIVDGTSVEIGGSVFGNTDENNWSSRAIQAGNAYPENMRPSYVRVGKDVEGNVSAFGSELDIGGSVTGKVDAYAKSVVSIGKDVIGDLYADLSTVDVKGHIEGRVNASGEGTSVSIADGIKSGSSELPYREPAVRATNKATVSVTGNVVNEAKAIRDNIVAIATAIIAQNSATVMVDGNVSAIYSDGSFGAAISVDNGSTVDVKGCVEGRIFAFDEGTKVKIGDYVNGRIIAYDGSTIDVQGCVENGIDTQGEGTSVSIGDYVKGFILARNGSTVDVQGHVNGRVQASGKGTKVTIGDGVSPNVPVSMPSYTVPVAIYVYVYNGAEVDVTGDVDGSIHTQLDGIVSVTGNVNGPIEAYLGSTVDVSGSAKQIYISNPTLFTGIPDGIDLGSTVRVGGDVANGVYISMYGDGTDHSKLTVEGTINSKGNAITLNVQPHVVMDIPQPTYPWQGDYSDDAAYQKAIEEYQQAQTAYFARERELLQEARNEMNTAEGVQTVIDNLPQIIVGTLAPDADFVLVNGMMNKDNQKKITEALLSQINYIVNMEGVDTANIAVYGYEELDGYLVAREQQKLTVKCINDNMVIANVSAGRYATIDANSDGSYTITVQRGGDLNLVVTARPKGVSLSMDRSGSSGTNSAYDEAQWGAWLSNLTADSAMRTLTLDLRTILTTDIPYETLRAYLLDYGIDTLIVITENAEYTMSIAEVLALAEDGSTFTFTARDGALELAVNGGVVSTFSVK